MPHCALRNLLAKLYDRTDPSLCNGTGYASAYMDQVEGFLEQVSPRTVWPLLTG